MNGRKSLSAPKLTIQRVFEPHRLSTQFLADVYERLFPPAKRSPVPSHQLILRRIKSLPPGGLRHEH